MNKSDEGNEAKQSDHDPGFVPGKVSLAVQDFLVEVCPFAQAMDF